MILIDETFFFAFRRLQRLVNSSD